MSPTARSVIAGFLAALATIASAGAAAARPMPVVPDASGAEATAGPPALEVVNVASSPLWQFALVALVAAAVAAAATYVLDGRSARRSGAAAPSAG